MIDITSNKCNFEDCNIRATFGIPANTASKCFSHKEIGMIVNPRKRCSEINCNETSTYQDLNSKDRYCNSHAKSDSINLGNNKCSSCGLLDILYHDNLCTDCDPNKIKQYTHAKELAIKAVLDVNNFKYESHDKLIDKGECIKNRPDFIFDANTHFVILEVDENQHKQNAQECEHVRMLNIYQALGMPTIFIRYNPDDFKDDKNIKIDISKSKRIDILLKWLKQSLLEKENPLLTNDKIKILYLFYDGYNQAITNYESLLKDNINNLLPILNIEKKIKKKIIA